MNTSPVTSDVRSAPPARSETTLLRRHPLLCFAVPVVAVTWAVQLTFLATGLPLFPALVIELVVLVLAAVLLTRRTTAPGGVRRLFAGIVRWRFGLGWWALVLLAMPLLTLLVAAATGTLNAASDAWGGAAFTYLFLAVVYGALLGNVWEEVGWTAYLQQRLMDGKGLLVGSLLTAIPFGLIHLPLIFEADGLRGTSLADIVLGVLALAGAAPFFRHLIGQVYLGTGRSLLAVALLHGSFNACASSALLRGGWQYVVAVVVLAVLVRLVVRTPAPASVPAA